MTLSEFFVLEDGIRQMNFPSCGVTISLSNCQ